GDAASAPVILKQVVTGWVFLEAGIEDAYLVTGRRDHGNKKPLVGSGTIVIYRGPGAPGGAAICGLDKIDVRLVGISGRDLIVVGYINVAGQRINRGMREPAGAEA